MSELRELLQKDVVVRASGVTYRGRLIEVSDSEVLLRSDSGWVSIQMNRVSSIRGADDDASDGLQSNKFVDSSFYDPLND